MAKDAQGHGSASGGGGMFQKFWAGSISQSVKDRSDAAHALAQGHPKSDPVPIHGGSIGVHGTGRMSQYYSLL